jgi:hypothetical protein
MKKMFLTLSLICTFAFSLFAYDFPVEKKEEIKKTLKFSKTTGEKYLELENINGSIDVIGYNGDDVQLTVHQTIEAKSDEKVMEAKEKERLEIKEEGDTITIFVDTPYRKSDGSVNYKGERFYGYKVTFDFELKVPYQTNIDIKTINDGDIFVEGIRGNFDLHNINGGIEMKGAQGSGKVYALNEDVKVIFDKNPSSDCYFGSLNGDVDVTFLDGLSADIRIKTFNGDAYTDFPVTHVPDITASKEEKKGKHVYKSNRRTRVRVGDGGPVLDFDGFNGDIRIVKK